MITLLEMNEIMNLDDWEYHYLIKHKQNPIYYPLDEKKFKESILESLTVASSGMYIGEGFHGGMTREEWTSRYNYLNNILTLL
jgi:hypothetical protein